MRTFLEVISAIVMIFAALVGFASMSDIGKTSTAGLEVGSAFGVVILAGILWMLTAISEQLSRLIAVSRETHAIPVDAIEPPLADRVPLPLGSKRHSMWPAVITVAILVVCCAIVLFTVLHSQAH